ncbi:MAG: hypothetical protein IID30_07475 [Planctomycetes bacterium]|nr:hypothetical protein [Planctomycetota bacterium]MCH7602535.1 hypothetical protein [Planctomycetota bacterium]
MSLLVNKTKLNAAAYSMPQFCPIVRTIFPEPVDDTLAEASTFFLYLQVARDTMGKRFAVKLGEKLIESTRASREEIAECVSRLSKQVATIPPKAEFHEHVSQVITFLLAEAGCPTTDQEVLRTCFSRFQSAVSGIKQHLDGIKNQNVRVLKRAS